MIITIDDHQYRLRCYRVSSGEFAGFIEEVREDGFLIKFIGRYTRRVEVYRDGREAAEIDRIMAAQRQGRPGPLPSRRLPVAPLMQLGGYDNLRHLALACGVSWANMRELSMRGLTIPRADEFATRCGLHPHEVWGDAFYESVHVPIGGTR